MAVVQINPPGTPPTTPGYISSITVRTAGADKVLVPDVNTGQVTIIDAEAATRLVQAWSRFRLISG
jgi:hypothetical protein